MKILIGTYRADWDLIDRCVDSMTTHLADVKRWEPLFVDDSGDRKFRDKLAKVYGAEKVHWVGDQNRGYSKAMRVACDLMKAIDDDYVGWWEEDFVATHRVHLDEIREQLDDHPNLAQIVLMRNAWFDQEKAAEETNANGVMADLAARTGKEFHVKRLVGAQVNSLVMHDMTFSTNPSIWAPMAYRWGWPLVHGSEERKTRYLVEDDNACFAWWGDRPMVRHDGERTGSGY